MKNIIISLFSFIYKLKLRVKYSNQKLFTSSYYKSKLSIDKNNKVVLNKTTVKDSLIHLSGDNNELIIDSSRLNNIKINIKGSGNTVKLDKGVRLIGELIIRGTNCKITIGKGTTFGGVRIVNVGVDNDIFIGEDCMFSDHIEIWASDSHTILNKHNDQINPEKPINIGNHVWVGSRVTILKGVTIGDNSIIGLGSMVTKDIYPNTVSVGVTNKEIATNVNWKNEYKTS